MGAKAPGSWLRSLPSQAHPGRADGLRPRGRARNNLCRIAIAIVGQTRDDQSQLGPEVERLRANQIAEYDDALRTEALAEQRGGLAGPAPPRVASGGVEVVLAQAMQPITPENLEVWQKPILAQAAARSAGSRDQGAAACPHGAPGRCLSSAGRRCVDVAG